MRHFLIILLLVCSIKSFSQNESYSIDTFQFSSEILKENRTIIIYKSLKISKPDSINFIYLIDGESSDYRFKQIKERFKDSIQNLIAIGIVNTDRRRDLLYAKAANKFLDFVTTELIPLIEKDYKTKNRILFGHSFGGGFTVYSLINKTDYFDYYIASSPTPIMDLIKKDTYIQIDNASKNRIVFYISFGSNDMAQVKKWSTRLNDNLIGVKFKNLDYRFTIFKGKDHSNSDISALINGLTDLKYGY